MSNFLLYGVDDHAHIALDIHCAYSIAEKYDHKSRNFKRKKNYKIIDSNHSLNNIAEYFFENYFVKSSKLFDGHLFDGILWLDAKLMPIISFID